jgi:hypothetical protein
MEPVPGSFADLASFKQELDLASGAIIINAASKKGESVRMKLWFAGENLIIESASKTKTTLEISFGSWRDITRDSLYIDMGKRIATLRADSIQMSANGIVWHHRNANYPSVLEGELKIQPLAVENICNPTENNVFGGAIVSNQKLTPGSKTPVAWQRWKGCSWTMTAAASKTHVVVAALRAEQGANPEKWLTEVKALLAPQALKAAAADEVN